MTERAMKTILPIGILAAGLIITAIMIMSRPPVPTRPRTKYRPVVRTVEVHPKPYRLTISAHGTVKPRTETALVAEVAGRVIEVAPSFAAGGTFARGEILLRVDPRDYELAVVSARSAVAQARVAAELEEAQAEVAREEWEELGDGRPSSLATREPQLEQARAALAAAQAALEKAQRDLERTRIRAPFDCRVRTKMADIGQYLAPGTPVADVFAVDYAEVRLPIPDSDLAYIDIPINFVADPGTGAGPEVILSADFAGGRRSWRARVVRVEGEIDPVSRMIALVAQVDDPYGRSSGNSDTPLTAGLFVDAEILGREVKDAVVLPRSAMRGKNRVLVVDGENKLRFREVEVVRLGKEEAVIGAGLSAGERVCVSLLEAVTDGMEVRTAIEADSTVLPMDISVGSAVSPGPSGAVHTGAHFDSVAPSPGRTSESVDPLALPPEPRTDAGQRGDL